MRRQSYPVAALKVREGYERWSGTYDSAPNRTRDLDEEVTREMLSGRRFDTIVELGCGTGKNTALLSQIGRDVLALDFSEAMIARARAKIASPNVRFEICDLTQPWPCASDGADLVIGNLVLEHIEDLDAIFREGARCLRPQAEFLVCELHPFRQYLGTTARFEHASERVELPAFVHDISEFLSAAEASGFALAELREWWHPDDKEMPPRLISFLFRKETR